MLQLSESSRSRSLSQTKQVHDFQLPADSRAASSRVNSPNMLMVTSVVRGVLLSHIPLGGVTSCDGEDGGFGHSGDADCECYSILTSP